MIFYFDYYINIDYIIIKMEWWKDPIWKEQNKKYREENKEYLREYNRKYYQENKEKRNGYTKKWQKNNKEKVKETQRKYNENNKEKIRERQRKYYQKNKDKKSQKIKCDVCDYSVRRDGFTAHKKTKKHQRNMTKLQPKYIELEC